MKRHRFSDHSSSRARRMVARLCLPLCALLCALLLAAPGALARPTTVAASDGIIGGVLVNGTHGNAPVAGQPVTLQAVAHGAARDVATATTDAQGQFAFGGLATAAADTYAVYTRYQGGLYSSPPIVLTGAPQQRVTLAAYDATSSDGALRVTSVTVLVRPPNPRNGLVGVGEFVSIRNSGAAAFVGATAPANGQPMGLLRFALPAGATSLTPGIGFVGAEVVQVDTGFGATATVPPGTSEFAFAFDVPYDGTQLTFSYKAEYPTEQVGVLVPPDLLVDARDFAARGNAQAFGARYQVFLATNAPAGATSSLRLENLPPAGEPSALDFRALLLVVALLAVLIALLLGLYLKRGALATAFVKLPGTARDRTARTARAVGASSADARETERRELLRQLLTLEQAHDRGTLDDTAYRAQAARTRANLRTVLAELAAAGDPRPASDASTAEQPPAVGAPTNGAPAQPEAIHGGGQ